MLTQHLLSKDSCMQHSCFDCFFSTCQWPGRKERECSLARVISGHRAGAPRPLSALQVCCEQRPAHCTLRFRLQQGILKSTRSHVLALEVAICFSFMHMEWPQKTGLSGCQKPPSTSKLCHSHTCWLHAPRLFRLRGFSRAIGRHARRSSDRQWASKARASPGNGSEESSKDLRLSTQPREGASTDLAVIWARLVKVGAWLYF